MDIRNGRVQAHWVCTSMKKVGKDGKVSKTSKGTFIWSTQLYIYGALRLQKKGMYIFHISGIII